MGLSPIVARRYSITYKMALDEFLDDLDILHDDEHEKVEEITIGRLGTNVFITVTTRDIG